MQPSRGWAVIAGSFAVETVRFGFSGQSWWGRRSSPAAVLANKAAEHVDALDALDALDVPPVPERIDNPAGPRP